MTGKYEDIINMPHHVSETRAQMSMHDRAAQFAPFQALTGYGDAVDETARITDSRDDMGEETAASLDRKFAMLNDIVSEKPEVTLIYFIPDEKKSGGRYETYTGNLRKIDSYIGLFLFADGTRIRISDVFGIESECFDRFEDKTD